MNANELIDLRMRSPFLPFEINLKDGTSVRVGFPNEVAIGRSSPECIVFESDDHIRFVAYRDIVGVTMAPANGSHRA